MSRDPATACALRRARKLAARAATRAAGASLLALACLLWDSDALARTERFALIAGSNQGLAHEVRLRYAESDAHKVYATLREIGGFEAHNMVLLDGGDAGSMQRALIDLNDRLRSARDRPGVQVVLFVYYSGHADAEDLHLGNSRFSIHELSKIVRGSAADFRLLVLDACRSGVLTRSKGGRMTQPFDIEAARDLHGEGLAFLTASAENEVAQESDELRGSFFTHALVSGLLGAADRDRDGNVVLDEAYHYAYESTLRASSTSASGLQHPTFFYDLRGQGQLVLTRPFAQRADRGVLQLPSGATYLVMRGDAHGQVAAEVAAGDPARSISLTRGTYFVRGRAPEHMLEGQARIESGRTTQLSPKALTRIAYAQLVRKGGAARSHAHAVELLGLARSPLPNADTPCYGALGGYRLDTRELAFQFRAGFCVSTRRSPTLSTRTRELQMGVRALRAVDLSATLSLDAGVGIAAVHFEQRFETHGRAPPRQTLAALVEGVLELNMELTSSAYAVLDASLQTYVLPMWDSKRRSDELRAAVSGRLAVGAGMRF